MYLHPSSANNYQWSGSGVGRDAAWAHGASHGQPDYRGYGHADMTAQVAYGRQQAEAARQQALYERQMREQWEEQKKNNEAARQAQANKAKALQSMAFGMGGGFGGFGGFGGGVSTPSVDLYSSSGNRIGGSFGPIKQSLLG